MVGGWGRGREREREREEGEREREREGEREFMYTCMCLCVCVWGGGGGGQGTRPRAPTSWPGPKNQCMKSTYTAILTCNLTDGLGQWSHQQCDCPPSTTAGNFKYSTLPKTAFHQTLTVKKGTTLEQGCTQPEDCTKSLQCQKNGTLSTRTGQQSVPTEMGLINRDGTT